MSKKGKYKLYITSTVPAYFRIKYNCKALNRSFLRENAIQRTDNKKDRLQITIKRNRWARDKLTWADVPQWARPCSWSRRLCASDEDQQCPACGAAPASAQRRSPGHHYISTSVSDPDPHWFWSAGSGSRRAKITYKNRKKLKNFKFEVLNVLFWGLKASTVAGTSFYESRDK